MAISLDELERCIYRLEEALNQNKNEFIRDSVIQRFEFTVERSWKTAMKIMGTNTRAPKQIIREMGQAKLVDDVVFWLQAIDHRNHSSHTYNESKAEEVYSFALEFLPEAFELCKRLKKMNI